MRKTSSDIDLSKYLELNSILRIILRIRLNSKKNIKVNHYSKDKNIWQSYVLFFDEDLYFFRILLSEREYLYRVQFFSM